MHSQIACQCNACHNACMQWQALQCRPWRSAGIRPTQQATLGPGRLQLHIGLQHDRSESWLLYARSKLCLRPCHQAYFLALAVPGCGTRRWLEPTGTRLGWKPLCSLACMTGAVALPCWRPSLPLPLSKQIVHQPWIHWVRGLRNGSRGAELISALDNGGSIAGRWFWLAVGAPGV